MSSTNGTTGTHQFRLTTYKEAELKALEYIELRRNGQSRSLITPWVKFNNAHIDGLEVKKVVTMAGMSSTGKSAIGGQLSRDLFLLNPSIEFDVLIFNYEMPSMDIVIRDLIPQVGCNMRELLSAGGEILSDAIYNRLVRQIREEDRHVRVYYVEYPQTVEQYKQICRQFASTRPNRILVVMSDHSILFKRGASDNDATDMLYRLGDASIELKKELDIIQVHFSQLNRLIEDPKRREKKSPLNYPTKDCLFGGDALYQCADTVMINHRPFLLNFPRDTYGPFGLPCGPNDLYWHFLKIRNGNPFTARMTADFANMRVLDGPTDFVN